MPIQPAHNYPRYFCHMNGVYADGARIICITENGSGYLLEYETGIRLHNCAYQLHHCLYNVQSGWWVEGTRYGPLNSELSWSEYAAVQKVVRRLTSAA